MATCAGDDRGVRAMSEPVRIAVLGLGEAGSEIARDLVAAGVDVRGYDPKVAPPDGVTPRADEADAVRDADLVLSVNSSHDAMTALVNALPAVRPGTIWADLNSASPGAKAELTAVAAPREVKVVDVALMSTVPGKGVRTPMIVSGDGAAEYAEVLAGFGNTVRVQPGPAGAAISRKLLRSVFWKGVAAAAVEAMTAADVAGCAEWLHDNIKAELVGFDEGTLDKMLEGSRKHARRRADEMSAAAEQLRELGVEARIAAAARDQLAELRDTAQS
jgi:3-hydroxyisobutyrate dehydrogenase-like beta-hydroxyacid dehydrogenase